MGWGEAAAASGGLAGDFFGRARLGGGLGIFFAGGCGTPDGWGSSAEGVGAWGWVPALWGDVLFVCVDNPVFGDEGFHYRPAYQVGDGAKTEYNEVAGWLAFKAYESEVVFAGVYEEVAGAFL